MLPAPIYIALPYLYIVSGVATYLFLDSPFAYMSVAALMIAGGGVFLMRMKKRGKPKRFQNSAIVRVRDPARK